MALEDIANSTRRRQKDASIVGRFSKAAHELVTKDLDEACGHMKALLRAERGDKLSQAAARIQMGQRSIDEIRQSANMYLGKLQEWKVLSEASINALQGSIDRAPENGMTYLVYSWKHVSKAYKGPVERIDGDVAAVESALEALSRAALAGEGQRSGNVSSSPGIVEPGLPSEVISSIAACVTLYFTNLKEAIALVGKEEDVDHAAIKAFRQGLSSLEAAFGAAEDYVYHQLGDSGAASLVEAADKVRF